MPSSNPPAEKPMESGEADDPMLPCDQNDVEVVSDLDEPNTIEIESEVEDDEPAGLVFAAIVQEPDGSRFTISEDQIDQEDTEPPGSQAVDDDESDE